MANLLVFTLVAIKENSSYWKMWIKENIGNLQFLHFWYQPFFKRMTIIWIEGN